MSQALLVNLSCFAYKVKNHILLLITWSNEITFSMKSQELYAKQPFPVYDANLEIN